MAAQRRTPCERGSALGPAGSRQVRYRGIQMKATHGKEREFQDGGQPGTRANLPTGEASMRGHVSPGQLNV